MPPLIGNGGDIFHTAPCGPSTPADDAAEEEFPDFIAYVPLLTFRGSGDTEDAKIYHPAEGDLGDNDGWYYVTIGRRVGVFNAW